MKKIAKPKFHVGEVVTACSSNYRDKQLQAKCLSSIPAICHYTDEYDKLADKGVLHTVPSDTGLSYLALTREELIDLYDKKLVPEKQPGRKYYDKIKMSTTFCPYCLIREVDQVDHYLPKADFSVFSVSPINLIPSCGHCNTSKKNPSIINPSDLHLHPYYDDALGCDETWLNAKSFGASDGEMIIEYSICKLSSWNEDFYARLIKHFNLFDLSKFYILRAVDYVCGQRYRWNSLKITGGTDALNNEIIMDVRSFEEGHGKNHWMTAFCRSLINNEWFLTQYIKGD